MNDCPLCNVRDKLWEEKGFFGVICKSCRVPLIVLQAHRAELTRGELITIKVLAAKHYPGRKARGIGLRSIVDHYHEHYIKEGL